MLKPGTNTLFPGHRNVHGEFDYRGPTSGWFSLLHHADNLLVEWSNNVMERVQYIVSDKPANEQAIRLRHIVFLGDRGADYYNKRASLDADYYAKLAPLYADYEAKRASLGADYYAKRASLRADYEAKRAPLDAKIIDYIKPLIDDFAWNGKELVF